MSKYNKENNALLVPLDPQDVYQLIYDTVNGDGITPKIEVSQPVTRLESPFTVYVYCKAANKKLGRPYLGVFDYKHAVIGDSECHCREVLDEFMEDADSSKMVNKMVALCGKCCYLSTDKMTLAIEPTSVRIKPACVDAFSKKDKYNCWVDVQTPSHMTYVAENKNYLPYDGENLLETSDKAIDEDTVGSNDCDDCCSGTYIQDNDGNWIEATPEKYTEKVSLYQKIIKFFKRVFKSNR